MHLQLDLTVSRKNHSRINLDQIRKGEIPASIFAGILCKLKKFGKEEKIVIKSVEYHTTSPEMILPLNDDMIIHVAPASGGTPVPEWTKAFVVPKGTMVKINTAIWHLAPLPVKEDVLHAMIILPECTYANDCTVVELKAEQQFEIVL